MRHSVVIACDSFKGCLSSAEVAEAICDGLKTSDDITVIPLAVADGGEGMADTLGDIVGAKRIDCPTVDPLYRPVTASYRLHESEPNCIQAYIDMAAAGGLPLLSPAERNPLLTSTYGVGIMIRDAIAHGATHIILGLGGSATNDAALGAIAAMGAIIHGLDGNIITHPVGNDLSHISDIDVTPLRPLLADVHITLAVDVTNPLSGKSGAAHVFAAQKGADAEMIRTLDHGLTHMETVFAKALRSLTNGRNHVSQTGFRTIPDIGHIPGAGAAGGMGAGLYFAILAATGVAPTMRSGADLVLDAHDFDALAAKASVVITGEGGADRQSLMGKITGTILRRTLQCSAARCILLAGCIRDAESLYKAGFSDIININDPAYLSAADLDKSPLDPQVARTRLANEKMITQVLLLSGF